MFGNEMLMEKTEGIFPLKEFMKGGNLSVF